MVRRIPGCTSSTSTAPATARKSNSPALRLATVVRLLLDLEREVRVHAILDNLVVLDDGLEVLDPDRFDLLDAPAGISHGALRCILTALLRLRDHLDHLVNGHRSSIALATLYEAWAPGTTLGEPEAAP